MPAYQFLPPGGWCADGPRCPPVGGRPLFWVRSSIHNPLMVRPMVHRLSDVVAVAAAVGQPFVA